MMKSIARVVSAVVLTVSWTPPVFSQQFSPVHSRLEAMLRDAETAAGLAASGKLLYDADTDKQDWSRYCSNAVALANRGEFRQAVREASKALFLGQSSNNTTALAFASRDLAHAYSLAGDLDAAERWAKHSLAHLNRSQARDPRAVSVPVQKALGDIAARRGDLEAALKYYEQALDDSYPADRLPVRLSIANAEIRRGSLNAARRILGEIGTDEPRWAPFALRARGQLEFAERNYAKSLEHFNAAVASMRAAENPYHLMWLQHGLAQVHAAMGERDKALAALNEAITAAKERVGSRGSPCYGG